MLITLRPAFNSHIWRKQTCCLSSLVLSSARQYFDVQQQRQLCLVWSRDKCAAKSRQHTTQATAGQNMPVQDGALSPLQAFMQNGARMTRGAHAAWAQLVSSNDTVIDATCGNGQDTLFLAKLVGPNGRVYAIDIQEAAVRSTKYVVSTGLPASQMPDMVYLQQCHSRMQEHVDGMRPVQLVCFNLGYYPGGGTRDLVTQPDTTVAGIIAATHLLQEGGIISVLVYLAHPGGLEEYAAVQEVASQLPSEQWAVSCHSIINRKQAPVLILLYKLKPRASVCK